LGFVPKGPNDRSDSTELAEVQAIHCLEHVQSRIRPVGTKTTQTSVRKIEATPQILEDDYELALRAGAFYALWLNIRKESG
jgi:hypothetical protein